MACYVAHGSIIFLADVSLDFVHRFSLYRNGPLERSVDNLELARPTVLLRIPLKPSPPMRAP